MPSFWRVVNAVLREADLFIEVLDARFIEQTRNLEVEQKIHQAGKKILYVITKSDLVPLQAITRHTRHLQPSVFISSTAKLGTTILKKKILEIAHGKPVVVGVLGYPNVGKSSLINAVAGRHVARTSPQSGFTKGLQKIQLDSKITLLDTPGVYPFKENDVLKHVLVGALDYAKVLDPETVALQLIRDNLSVFQDHYGLGEDDPEEFLDAVAVKYKKLGKGGRPDLGTAARLLLRDWQEGKIRTFKKGALAVER